MAEFRVPSAEDYAEALERGRKVYASPRALSARLDRERRCIVVRLDQGDDFIFDPTRQKALATATLSDLANVVVEGAGSTLRFPALDADLTLSNLPDFPGGPR